MYNFFGVPSMTALKLNQILISKDTLPKVETGTRFVVKRGGTQPSSKISVYPYNKKGEIEHKGFVLKLSAIDKYFSRTNEVHKDVLDHNYKKGDLIQVKKAFENPNNGKLIEVGARGVVLKGGKRIEFSLVCDPYVIWNPHSSFVVENLEHAEPMLDKNLIGVGIKNLKASGGEETPRFNFDFTYRGKVVGYAKNSGNGEANSFTIHDSPELRKIFKDLVSEVATKIEQHPMRVEETLVDYFLQGYYRGVCSFKEFAVQ